MKLSALIQGKRTAISFCPATANLANVAKDDAKQVDILPRLAGLATLALATAGENEILNATLPTVATEEELMQMIRDAYTELDTLRDWTGWRQSLTTEQRRHIVAVETRIDTTYGSLDREGLAETLNMYRETCLQSRKSMGRMTTDG